MTTTPTTLQERLAEQLMDVFAGAAENQRAFYAAHPEARPDLADIDRLITSCANTNALISGALNLVPGPFGLLAIVPELVTVIRNQVKLVYDIGVASGKEKALGRELLLGVVLAAFGQGGLGLLVLHGSKVLVKRSTLRLFQRLVAVLAGRVTQQVLRSAIAKWLPLVGAAAMAVWARQTTVLIGRKAKEIFAMEIVVEDDEAGDGPSEAPAASSTEALVARILVLSNLMKVDGESSDEELDFLDAMLVGSELDDATVARLRAAFDSPHQAKVDLTPLRTPEESLSLVMDLLALANRDGAFRPAEKVFVRQVAGQVGFPPADLETLLS